MITLRLVGGRSARVLATAGAFALLAACRGGTPEAGRITTGDTVSAGEAAGAISGGAGTPAYVDTAGSALNPGGVVPVDTAHQRMTNMGPGRQQAPVGGQPATTPPTP